MVKGAFYLNILKRDSEKGLFFYGQHLHVGINKKVVNL
jgi:hypothetical protein